MQRLAWTLLAVAACGGDAAPTGTIAAHVTHYDYTFDLASRAAHSTVTAVVDEPGDCFTLPFRATALDTAGVLWDGKAADSATLDTTANTLTVCGTGHAAGDTFTLDSDQTVALATLEDSQVGYSVKLDTDGNPFTYMVSWVNGCDQFGPCDNRPDIFATYHFTVTHDASLTVRCSGDVTDDSPTQTECDFTDDGGPTYSTFGLAAYPAWTQSDAGMWGGVHVTIYDRADTDILAAIDDSYHDGFLRYMENLFGPYPFGSELRVLTAPTYWNGFEHPGNIVLADTLQKQARTSPYANNVAHTLDHEMTHMWAGNQTTLAGTYDFAWKESMAEYLPFTYEATVDEAVATRNAAAWKSEAHAATYWPVPDDMPTLFDYYGDVYGAGPMVLFRQLEALTSRAQVIAAIQSTIGSPHALSIDELVAALSASTGLDLTAYSQQWIHGTGTPVWPQIAVTYDQTAGTLAIHQTNQAAGVRGCAFHVGLYAAPGTPGEVDIAVDTFHDGPDQTIPVTDPGFTVVNTGLDPQNECLVFVPATTSARAPVHTNPWVAPRDAR